MSRKKQNLVRRQLKLDQELDDKLKRIAHNLNTNVSQLVRESLKNLDEKKAELILFDDQKTGMKITMQEYFTPKHNKLHKIGITPDIELELPEEWKGHLSVEREFDNQLNKAVEILK